MRGIEDKIITEMLNAKLSMLENFTNISKCYVLKAKTGNTTWLSKSVL